VKILSLLAVVSSAQYQPQNFDNHAPVDVRGGASLQVIHPPELAKKVGNGFIEVSLGNFGDIVYGTSVTGNVHIPEENKKGCEPFAAPFPNNVMVLVQAGHCPITTKVRYVEQAGGQIALVGDSLQDDPEDVFMEDVDGSGFSLNIPALLIDNVAEDLIIEQIKSGKTVTLKAQIEISHADSRKVEVGLWYGSILDIPSDLLKSLYNY
jgi:hypothetical protein